MKNLFLIMALLGLSACATQEQYSNGPTQEQVWVKAGIKYPEMTEADFKQERVDLEKCAGAAHAFNEGRAFQQKCMLLRGYTIQTVWDYGHN